MKNSKKPNFWKDFRTKASATAAIQDIINAQDFKMPFESALISDLIVELHYFCSKHELRPTRFRKIPSYSAYSFEGDFTDCKLDPPIGWHPVSWTKCLKPPQTDWDRVVRAMRDRCEPIKAEYKSAHPICETCKILPSAEVHHSSPRFFELCQSICPQIKDSDIADCLGDWDWFNKKDFALPEGHKITEIFDDLHDSCKLAALCKACHNITKRKNL